MIFANCVKAACLCKYACVWFLMLPTPSGASKVEILKLHSGYFVDSTLLSNFQWKSWREYLDNLGINRILILQGIFKRYSLRMWTAFMWLRMWTSDGVFWTQCLTFEFLGLCYSHFRKLWLVAYWWCPRLQNVRITIVPTCHFNGPWMGGGGIQKMHMIFIPCNKFCDKLCAQKFKRKIPDFHLCSIQNTHQLTGCPQTEIVSSGVARLQSVYTYCYHSENSEFTQLAAFCGVNWCIAVLKMCVNLLFAWVFKDMFQNTFHFLLWNNWILTVCDACCFCSSFHPNMLFIKCDLLKNTILWMYYN